MHMPMHMYVFIISQIDAYLPIYKCSDHGNASLVQYFLWLTTTVGIKANALVVDCSVNEKEILGRSVANKIEKKKIILLTFSYMNGRH